MPVDLKIAQIARWRLAGIKDTVIQGLIKMSPGGFYRLVNTQSYKDYEEALKTKHLAQMDAALEGSVTAIRQELHGAVPAAMRCLLETVNQRKDMKAALEAAKEILDRDPEASLSKNRGQQSVAPGLSAELLESATAEADKLTASMTTEVGKAKVN
jgi:hypothetical protein